MKIRYEWALKDIEPGLKVQAPNGTYTGTYTYMITKCVLIRGDGDYVLVNLGTGYMTDRFKKQELADWLTERGDFQLVPVPPKKPKKPKKDPRCLRGHTLEQHEDMGWTCPEHIGKTNDQDP